MADLAGVLLSMHGGSAYQLAEQTKLAAMEQARAEQRAADVQAAYEQWERNVRAGEALLVRAGRERPSFVGTLVQGHQKKH